MENDRWKIHLFPFDLGARYDQQPYAFIREAQKRALTPALSSLKRPSVSSLEVKVESQLIHSIALEKKMTTRC